MDKVGLTIIGAGVVGLALAAELSADYDSLFVLEKETTVGSGISSRNSEVVHAGIYYPPHSLKASLCIEGNRLLTCLCQEKQLPFFPLGKYIVATNADECDALERLYENALESGLDSLVKKTASELQREEPAVQALAALYSPTTAVLNAHALMDYFHQRGKENGVEFGLGITPQSIQRQSSGDYLIQVRDTDGDTFEFLSEVVINAAGLASDTIAEMAGIDIDQAGYRLHYCKGDYFLVQGPTRRLLNHLVYPVPQPKLKGLGIHVTLDVAGNMHLGPDATYIERDLENYDVSESKKQAFWESAHRFFPALNIDDIHPERSGIRPKLQGPDDAFRDFVIAEETDKGLPGFINLIGIESPGLTAALAIGRHVRNTLG